MLWYFEYGNVWDVQLEGNDMIKLILGVLAAGMLATGAQARGGHWGGGGFAIGAASGLFLGAALSRPWYYHDSYYGYYDGYAPYYRSSYYTPSYYYYTTPAYSAPVAAPAPQQAAPVQQTQPTTIINNYNYYNSGPMSGANSLFGR